MTTAPLLDSPDVRSSGPEPAARISFRQPVATSGFVDAAWWPRSRDLLVELPALLDVLWTAGREITRVSYNLSAWDSAPRRTRIAGRTVRLGGFTVSDPRLVTLLDSWQRERIDVLVIPPETDPDVAERAMQLASVADDPYSAAELLTHAAEPTR